MKNYLLLLCCAGLIGLTGALHAANPAITATVDSDHIASGATVRLRVQRSGTSNGQLDLSPLKADFDILGRNTGSSVQINNGDMTSQTQVDLILAPKHDGTIQIPSLEWNGEHTQPLTLTVGGAGSGTGTGQQGGSGDAQHVTLTASVDQSQPYVQSAVVLTVRLSTDQPLQQASLELAPNDAVLISQLGKDQQLTETRNGHTYQVIQRKYLVFPQRSGNISIEGPLLAAQVPDMSAGNGIASDPFFADILQNSGMSAMMQSMRPMRPLHLRAKAIELKVLPRPAGQTGANWLPALSMKISESWNGGDAGTSGASGSSSIHVGEPLTRHIKLEAVGLTAAKLPELSTLITAPDGFKIYPDKATLTDQPKGDSIIGEREQDIALIASQPGHYTLPAIRLTWWDTINNVEREATLPEHALEVLPAVGGSSPSPGAPAAGANQSATQPNNGNATATAADTRNTAALPGLMDLPRWLWIAMACISAALLALSAWWMSRRRATNQQFEKVEPVELQRQSPPVIKTQTGSAAGKFKEFQQACLADDPLGARRHLMEWSQLHWPDNPPIGLNALAEYLNDPVVAPLLRELDRCCYTEAVWKGDQLANALRVAPTTRSSTVSGTALPELYP